MVLAAGSGDPAIRRSSEYQIIADTRNESHIIYMVFEICSMYVRGNLGGRGRGNNKGEAHDLVTRNPVVFASAGTVP